MGDSVNDSELIRTTNGARIISGKKLSRRCSDSFIYKVTSKHIASIRNGKKNGCGMIGDIGFFVLKVAALETVRRFSKAKCPFVWRGLQALQVLSYPPLKWIQKLAPFKRFIRGVEMFSRPLLVLSIATALTEEVGSDESTPSGTREADQGSDVRSELSSVLDAEETRVADESPRSSASEIWLVQLHIELEKQGIELPERMKEDELRRFHRAANGDFLCFLSSIKKTIRWRETYRVLSAEELEIWSDMVFWHGFDVEQRPCLVVRLGLACRSMPPHDRPRFAQAVISHIDHGVLHLLDAENPEITVLVDCEGLSPFRFPMQIMRTCSSLLQSHYPNRLGCLFVIRLPSIVRVLAHTFIQMLKPVTRKKLRIEGEMFRKVLSEHLETLPAYLGGKCTCEKCLELRLARGNDRRTESIVSVDEGEDPFSLHPTLETAEADLQGNCNQIVRTAMVTILMIWVFLAFIAGIVDPETRPFSSPP